MDVAFVSSDPLRECVEDIVVMFVVRECLD